MNRNRTIRISLSAIGGFVALLVLHSLAAAQCAMCKNAITGSPDAGRLAANFNFAVLVLLIPPVMIFCGIFFAVFKYRKTDGDGSAEEVHRPNSSGGGLASDTSNPVIGNCLLPEPTRTRNRI